MKHCKFLVTYIYIFVKILNLNKNGKCFLPKIGKIKMDMKGLLSRSRKDHIRYIQHSGKLARKIKEST